MLTKKLLMTATAAIAGLAHAPAQADTLEEALVRAYENNPGVERSRALTRATDEGIVQARAAYGPNISANVTHAFTRRNTIVEAVDLGRSEGFATTATLNLAQPLFTSGRLAAGVDLATAQAERARQDLRAASQQLVLDVITAYVSLQRDIELYEVSGGIYELLRQQRDIQAARLELRDATAPDVQQTESRMQLAAARVVLAKAAVEASAAAYRALVGVYPEELAPPPELPELPPLEELYALAEIRNPELLSAQFAELGSRAQLAGARAERGPRVDANLQAGRIPLGLYANDPYGEDLSASVTLNMPLYTGGLVSSVIRDTLQRNIVAQNNLEQRRRTVRQSLATNWNAVQSSLLAIPRFAAAVEVAERAIEGTQQQQIAGIRTLRDVLETTNDLFAAQSNAAQVAADRYIQHASVLRDAGILTIDLFVEGVEYDPDSYSPGVAGIAGLPFEPVLEPVDALLVANGVRSAGVEKEDDLRYENADLLIDPLSPMAP